MKSTHLVLQFFCSVAAVVIQLLNLSKQHYKQVLHQACRLLLRPHILIDHIFYGLAA